MRNKQILILSGADTGSVNGDTLDVAHVFAASFCPVFGDVSAAGTVKIQCSNDICAAGNRESFETTNWADIPSATSTISSGVGPAIVLASLSAGWIRAVYTRSSGGSTTVKVYANISGF
jgi:hypothetical protein